jgi:hypothetical protein
MKPILVLVVVVVSARAAFGQSQAPPMQTPAMFPNCTTALDRVRSAADAAARQQAVDDLVEMNLHVPCLAELLTLSSVQHDAFGQFVKAFETRRTDKQAGSSAGAGGSTNLVSKGITSRILSLAAEYGALTESVNAQIVTVQGSLDGIPAALVRQQLVPYCPAGSTPGPCLHQGAFEQLRRVSYGVSFDTSGNAQQAIATPGSQPQEVTFDAAPQSITGATLRYILVNKRDAVSTQFQKAWNDKLKALAVAAPLRTASAALIPAMNALLKEVEPSAAYTNWQADTKAAIASAANDTIEEIWARQAMALGDALRVEKPEVFDLADTFSSAVSRFRFEQQDFADGLANTPVVTLEYDYKKPLAQPATSTVRGIFDKGFGERLSVALNVGVEWYDKTPAIAGTRQLRDVQFGVQLQRDLGTLAVLGAAAVSGSYYYQYQASPAVLDVVPGAPLPGIIFVGLPPTATQVFADTGSLHVGQVRLVLGAGESGLRFPISVSYSNHTELVAKPVFRAQVGVSYDFDALFAR